MLDFRFLYFYYYSYCFFSYNNYLQHVQADILINDISQPFQIYHPLFLAEGFGLFACLQVSTQLAIASSTSATYRSCALCRGSIHLMLYIYSMQQVQLIYSYYTSNKFCNNVRTYVRTLIKDTGSLQKI